MEKRHFTAFYHAYVDRIYKFVFYRVGADKNLAQDLTQDVFLKAYEAFERYDPTISESSWLYTIARNHVINQHAKSHPGVTLEDVEGTVWASEDGRARLSASHDEKKMLAALAKLPPEDAELIRMKYLEGWPFEELAVHFQKKSGALRVQARRALKKLKSCLKDPNV